MRTRLTAAVAACLLSGCAYEADIVAREDPAYAPTPGAPTAVVVADNSTIQDRQLLPVLRDQMTKRGFRLVDVSEAQWIVGFGGGTNAVFSGTSSTAAAVPLPYGQSLAVGSSKAEYADVGRVLLVVFSGDSFRQGKPLPVWQATASVKGEVYDEKPKTIINVLLDYYGKNYSERGRNLPRMRESRY